ncbi:hypothetical protein ACF09J_32780 [Streptomyces sp. NPDC014889]|uniref:hypothetical protein n=1 Tax=Streptomyces sp. NPDC014889 TaxID=3364928 RepID=UPI0036FCA811
MTNPVFGTSSVPMTVALKDTRKVFSDVGVAEFTGRIWLVESVDSFLAEQSCGFLWVEAEAGLGKTAWAAWLVRERGYVSHFARHSQGGSVRVGLRNLAAQLIHRFGLAAQFAPGGMLADWVSDPEGFDTLLSEAAERARVTRGEPLVIVMDGADEADVPAGGLPWGLPSLLPEGVFVVGTYRTGKRPAYSESPSRVVRIDRDDARNQADLQLFLDRAVRAEPVAGRLAAAGVSPDEAAVLLAERSGGVWVYLRYVLAGLRTGQQPVDELHSLPADLSGYYARQLMRWQGVPGWADVGKQVLATLVAAPEALPYSTLYRLTGASDQEAVRGWCDLVLRPFLTADDALAERRYELYHATARGFFGGALDGVHDDGLKVLAAGLAEGVARAHLRISERYVRDFGGFGSGDGQEPLALLAADPSLALMDGGYPLRHLAHHMILAEWGAGLRQLLQAESPAGDRQARNIWFAAHEYAGPLDAYLDDLERARSDAARRTDEAMRRRLPAAELAEELRYGLMTASVASHTDSVGPELLGQLVERGVWTAEHGLAHARRLSDPGDRYRALLVLQPHIAESQRLRTIEEALETIRLCDYVVVSSLNGHHYVSPALVIPYLPEDRQADVADEAVATAQECMAGGLRGRLLAIAAVHSPPEKRSKVALQALKEIRSEEDAWDSDENVSALVSLVSLLPVQERDQALSEVRKALLDGSFTPRLTEDWNVLLPLLSPEEQNAALSAAIAEAAPLEYPQALAHDLAVLLPVLPAEHREPVLLEMLTQIRSISHPADRAGALSMLLPHVPPEIRSAMIKDILGANSRPDQHVLARLAPYVTAEQLKDRLRGALFTPSTSRVVQLASLVLELPASRQSAWAAEVLEVATLVGSLTAIATGKIAVLQTALEAHRTGQAREALDALRLADAKGHRRDTLRRRLLPHLSEADVQEAALEWFSEPYELLYADQPLLEQVVAYLPADLLASALWHWVEQDDWVDDLSVLGPHLSEQLQEEVVTTILNRKEVDNPPVLVVSLIPYLPNRLLERVLAAGRGFEDAGLRSAALSALVPRLPVEQRRGVAQEAYEAALACSWRPWLPEVLPRMLAGLPEGLQHRVEEALTSVRAVDDEWERAEAYTVLLSVLSEQERSAVFPEVLDFMSQVDPTVRAQHLVELVPYMPWERVDTVLAIAPDDSALATALLSRAQDDHGCSPQEFVALVRGVLSRTSQSRALEVITENLSRLALAAGDEVQDVLAQATDDVLTWWP